MGACLDAWFMPGNITCAMLHMGGIVNCLLHAPKLLMQNEAMPEHSYLLCLAQHVSIKHVE